MEIREPAWTLVRYHAIRLCLCRILMDFQALRDVNIRAFVVKETVIALTAQIVRLGVSSRVLQKSGQSYNCMQEQVLPDLAHCHVCVTLK